MKIPLIKLKFISLFCMSLMFLIMGTPSILAKAATNNLQPLICIDTPQNNSKQSVSEISLSGWSLSVNGVKSVQASIDGQNSQSTSVGILRQDVAKVYSGYSGAGSSGYNLNLNISQLSNGEHTIAVTSMGNNGSIKSQNINMYKVPANSNNLAGVTWIDSPTTNSYVSSLNNKVNIAGWSVDGYGIQKVQVYVDNNYNGDASIGLTRTDVGNAYPGDSGSGTSGYSYSLDTSSIPDGNHTILVKSIGNGGAVSSNTVNINKVSSKTNPPIVCIDNPTNSQVNGTQINVAGWSLNLYGVQKVQVYVDNIYNEDATIGLSRADVNNVYPGYQNGASSGYSANLNISALSNGIHTITVKSVGNDGNITNQNTLIYKLQDGESSLSSMVDVDAPLDGAFYKNQPGQVNVVGWSLNVFGVQKVQIYFDNAYQGDASIGLPRADVNNVYPGYTGGVNSGYTYNLNLPNISDGAHIINVKSIGNNGETTTKSLKLYKFSSSGQSTLYNISLQSMVNSQIQYGQPLMESGSSWVSANSSTVQYYIDPMNFMDSYGIYQFLRLDYMQGVTADDLNSMLSGKGVLQGKGAEFLAAAQQSNINPIYLVSHALLESGNGTSQLGTGVVVNGKSTYNLFGIGADDSSPIVDGAQYAYNQGWFSVDQAIYGGANWISTWYINNSTYKQNTLYKMRWNPASPTNHQYATDVRWAYNQIDNIKKLMDMVQSPVLQFDVPQYK